MTPIERAANTDSVAKPALVLMTGRMLAFAATFFIPVVLARSFNPAQFGTYKQLFLIQSTIFYIAQMGMATSLYYFLPLSRQDAGRYVANSLVFLAGTGLAGMAFISATAPQLARWMSNDALAPYLPWMGAYLALTMIAAPFEIVLIARARYPWASAAYALTDIARAAALILPALSQRLDWVVEGAAAMAALRAAAALFYFRKEFGRDLTPDSGLFRRQWAYAFPFSIAVMIEIVQGNLPQYLVSYLTNPAAFAIFAVGCLQIPLVDLATSPSSDVMMVKMQESIARGAKAAVLGIWHDTTWKLAVLFLPLTALMMSGAHEIILMLYTPRYRESVPLFTIWALLILTSTLQVDGVLRVFAETRFLLVLNLTRLAIVAGLIQVSLRSLHLAGPVIVIVLANACFKLLALVRMRKLLNCSFGQLLPWRRLGPLLRASIGAVGPVLLLKSQLHMSPFRVLLAIGPLYIVTYVALIWRSSLLEENERTAIVNWVRRAFQRASGLIGREAPAGALETAQSGD
ncbi:MAG: oligosaccharide flippase family protein [Bryobacterales bacterium]|nr:oligosaccharide flippase family protein [Bryobacterales bacterium]MBV9401768.1 oligosaccharide flippase family protein [Bryobacterales bacterium]